MRERGCANCGAALESEHATKYCSQECFHDGHSFAGKNNPNYRGAKETAHCELCGARFEFYPSDKPGLYCSDCVENEQWRTPPRITGPDHPRWSGGKVTKHCGICRAEVTRYPSGFVSDVVLCGQKCREAWLSDAFTGQGHPNWKGGGNEAYGKGWAEARREALRRDNGTCLGCGKTKDELGRNPDVHHIVPVRSFLDAPAAEKTDAHVPRNLITLCVACHRRADFGRPSKAELKRLVEGSP